MFLRFIKVIVYSLAHLFSWLNAIFLHEYTMIPLSILLLIDILIVFILGLFWGAITFFKIEIYLTYTIAQIRGVYHVNLIHLYTVI